MAAYAVQVRIERVRPQRPTRRRDRARPIDPVPATAAVVELAVPTPPSRFAERWERITQLWSQTTFYLFDGDSWRH